MKLSIVIPTIRQDAPCSCAQLLLESKCPHEIEIIIVSPIDLQIPHTRHVLDDKVSGCTYAFNIGCREATGDYIYVLPDDHILYPGWWLVAEHLDAHPWRYPILTYRGHNVYNPAIMVPMFFCFHRFLLQDELFKGDIFNPAYAHQFPDCDLGFRLFEKTGESVPIVPHLDFIRTDIRYHLDNVNTQQKNRFFCVDELVFFCLWHHLISNIEHFCGEKHVYTHEHLIAAADQLKKDNRKSLISNKL